MRGYRVLSYQQRNDTEQVTTIIHVVLWWLQNATIQQDPFFIISQIPVKFNMYLVATNHQKYHRLIYKSRTLYLSPRKVFKKLHKSWKNNLISFNSCTAVHARGKKRKKSGVEVFNYINLLLQFPIENVPIIFNEDNDVKSPILNITW